MAHGPRWTQGRQEAGGQETGGQETGRLFDAARRRRSVLLLGTALQATASLLLVTPGRAQPAVNARPSGGVVTAGSASIGTSASTTTITQSSQRAAINWQSFNVGAQQTVDFVQPSSSSVALNRVISSDPSQIAGHIDANGQIILINQSGVIFYHGAQVNTAGLIVSAAGMSDVNFMAGKLVFDQAARPNAAVVNQGTLTVQQAGLAALVAPRVANSGVIDAKLGQVVLAGAKTATLDLYGDGLLALDVSNAVTQVPIGANGQKVTALVTNTGVIEADGGSVQLTARAADGLVQNLVQAGGKIVADSVGSKTGTVVLGGLGGSIVLSGVVSADGSAPGSHGGQVQADASEGVKLATGSRISASGPAGGGTVAVGTTLARAAGGPGTASALTAKTVQVDQGASIAADATSNGDGGRVTVLSSLSTSMAGKISANGGPLGGNGGFVEVSGEQGFALTGSIDVSAQLGNLGTILLDPTNLTIIAGATGDGDQDGNLTTNGGTILASGPDTTNDTVSNGAIDGLTGNVLLQATQSITINANAPISLTATAGQALTLEAGGTIAVHASITATGDIILATGGAGPGTAPPAMASPLIVVQNAAVTSTGGSVSLLAGPGGTVALGGIIGNIVTSGTLTAASGKLVTLQMDTLAVAGPASLITAPSGAIEIAPATPDTDVTLAGAGGLSITAAALAHMSTGTLRIGAATINGTRTRTAASITVAGTVDLAGIATTLELDAGGPITGTAAPLLNVGTLIASGTVINLQNPSNTITNLGNVTGNTFELDDDTNLTVLGTVNGGTTATISDSGGVLAISGTVSAGAISLAGLTLTITGETTDGGSGTTNLLAYTGGIAETGGTVIAGTLTGSSVGSVSLGVTSANTITTLGAFGVSAPAGSFALTDTRSLSITGAVSAQNGIYIESAGAAGIQLGAAASVTTGGGVIVGFQADAFSIANGGTVVGVGAQFELAPNTQGLGVTLGASGIGLELDATGQVTETIGATLTAATLTGTAAGFQLSTTGNAIGTIDDLTATGGNITVVDGESLVLTGTQSGNNLFFEVATAGDILSLGTIVDSATISTTLTAATGGRISLVADKFSETAGNSVTATGGTVELAPFSAINTSRLGSSGLVIDATMLSAISTGATGTLVVGGFTDVPNGAIAPAARASSISVDAATDVTSGIAGTLDLLATGPVSQSATLTVGTLIGTAGTVTLTNPGNDITTLGSFTATTAQFALDDNGNAGTLTVTGPVTAATDTTVSTGGTGAIDVTGSIGAGSILAVVAGSGGLALNGSATLTGTTIDLADGSGTIALNGNAVVGQSGASVDLIATGNINQAASATLVAATLQASSNAVVDLAGTANAVGALNGVVATTSFTLNDSANLVVNAVLQSPRIALLAPGQRVSLGAGATIITGGSPPASPGPLVPAQEPSNGAPGAYIEAASFSQIGSSTLTALGNAKSTLEISVSNSAQFDPPLGLQASNGWLILNLGAGTAGGNVFVNALNVTYGGPGGANLFGSIDGIAGRRAAASGFIQPAVNANYTFNGCEIGALACLGGSLGQQQGGGLGLGSVYPLLPEALPPLLGLPTLVLLAVPPLATPACELTDPNVVPPNAPQPNCALTDPDVVPPNVSYVDY